MKAMILAAGLGTRLRPLTETLPKALLPVGGRPLIHYHLLLLKRFGISDVFINLHHYGEKIVREIGNGSRFGLKVIYSEEPVILGTGGGVKRLCSELSAAPFIVLNADILIDIDLDDLVEFHDRKKGAATLVLREDPEADRYGPVDMDDQNRIRDILGQCDGNTGRLRRFMFTGAHLLEPKVLEFIPSDRFYSITDAYIAMVDGGERLYGYQTRGYWTDIGVPERYRDADQAMKEGRIELGYLKP